MAPATACLRSPTEFAVWRRDGARPRVPVTLDGKVRAVANAEATKRTQPTH